VSGTLRWQYHTRHSNSRQSPLASVVESRCPSCVECVDYYTGMNPCSTALLPRTHCRTPCARGISLWPQSSSVLECSLANKK